MEELIKILKDHLDLTLTIDDDLFLRVELTFDGKEIASDYIPLSRLQKKEE